MSDYIILNLEDKIGNYAQIGSADSTIQGLTGRYEGRKQNKGLKRLFLGKNKVTEQRCVEENPVGFTQDATRIAAIKQACAGAKKIYVVAHGDPRQTDWCFTNNVGTSFGVHQLSRAQELAAFLGKVLPASSKKPVKVALVMCYGARCREWRSAKVNHMGMVHQDDLRTSFAYGLFYHLVQTQSLNVRLTALTGKIQHESTTGQALVEHEDMIDINMDIAELDKAKRASMIAAVGQLLPQDQQDETYKANYAAWKTGAGKDLLAQANQLRKDRKDLASNLYKTGQNDMMGKYGKFLYNYSAGTLHIISKYGNPNDVNMKPGTVLYSGGLLTPN